MTHLTHVITHTRAQNRPNSHGAILLARIDALTAAIQSHHDTRWTGGRAVLSPPDRALYEAAGVAHRVLGTTEGGDTQPVPDGEIA